VHNDRVYEPVRQNSAEVGKLARRERSRGGTLLLVSNEKPKARPLLLYLGAALQELLSLDDVRLHTKQAASMMLSAADVEQIGAGVSYAVTGVGDCGSCSSCSPHDAIEFEKAGIPATVVITSVFEAHVRSFARVMGIADYPACSVQHQVATMTDEEIRALARGVAATVAQRLTLSTTT
jgi:hypothetical protein